MQNKIKNNRFRKDKGADRRERKFGKNQGIANKNLREPQPTYEQVGSEKIDKGKNNTFIIQGRDRPGVPQSGYGGRGATQAGRIDLIAGLAASYRHEGGLYGSPPNEDTIVSPNFAIDASRIYITQLGDIDEYMGLAFVDGQPEGPRSAIALKSDVVRIHSRQDIKIVTGPGKFEGIPDGERLSNGGLNDVVGKICFIAGNNTDEEEYISFNILEPHKLGKARKRKLQPVVKGDNLVMCLNDMVDLINQLSQFVGLNTALIRSLNYNFMAHAHPVLGPTTGPVNSSLPSSLTSAVNNEVTEATRKHFSNGLSMMKNTYLTKHTDPVQGALCINSNFVFTT